MPATSGGDGTYAQADDEADDRAAPEIGDVYCGTKALCEAIRAEAGDAGLPPPEGEDALASGSPSLSPPPLCFIGRGWLW